MGRGNINFLLINPQIIKEIKPKMNTKKIAELKIISKLQSLKKIFIFLIFISTPNKHKKDVPFVKKRPVEV